MNDSTIMQSLRFNLNYEEDQKLWKELNEYPNPYGKSMNKLIKEILSKGIKFNNMIPAIGVIEKHDDTDIKDTQVEIISETDVVEIDNTIGVIDELDEPSVFTKGQIWSWVDPIYGYKDHHKSIPGKEATMRYSRQVLIVQNPESIHNSVLVVPLSSTFNDPYDIKIDKIFKFEKSTSYARTRLLFPVAMSSLSKYICTISSKTLLQVIMRICQLLLHHQLFNLLNDYGKENLKMKLPPLLPIDENGIVTELVDEQDYDQEESIDSIDSECDQKQICMSEEIDHKLDVFPVTNKEDVEDNEIIKDKGDDNPLAINNLGREENMVLYVLGHKQITASELSRFFNVSNKTGSSYLDKFTSYGILSRKYKNKPRQVLINNVFEIPSSILMKFKSIPDTLTYILTKKKNKEIIDYDRIIRTTFSISNGREMKWTDEKNAEFMEFYTSHGITETMEKYQLSRSSVYSKYSKLFKGKDKDDRNGIAEGTYDNCNHTIPDVKDIDIYLIVKIISQFSKYVEYKFKDGNIFQAYKSSGKGKSSAVTYFYTSIRTGIYLSIMQLLGIESDAGNYSVQDYDILASNIDTIETLLQFNDVNNVCNDDNFLKNYVDIKYHINKEWHSYLYEYFKNKFNKNSYNVVGLTSYITSMYCKK